MKKTILVFLMFIIISSVFIPIVYCATDEGYGESNTNLGQVVDSYEDDNNISSAYQVIVNTTLDVVELNYTESSSIIWEDFEEGNINDWTDSGNAKTRMSASVDMPYSGTWGLKAYTTSGSYDSDWIYRTYTSTNIDEIQFFWRIISFKDTCTFFRIQDNADNQALYLRYSADNLLYHSEDGGWQNTPDFDPDVGIWYKMNIVIDSDAKTFDISIDDDLKIANKDWSNTACPTLSQIQFMTQAGTGNSRYYTDDIGFMGGGYLESGWFNTTDYFDYTNGSSLVYMINSSIPIGTTLKVQFSPNGTDFYDNEGNVGSNILTEGFLSLDLRNLNYTSLIARYNFTGTALLTPRLYQSRLISTSGGGVGININYMFLLPVAITVLFISVMSLVYLSGRGNKKR